MLEARHRPHARVEDRIRCGNASGLFEPAVSSFAANDAWLALAGVAATLVCWAQALLLDDPHLKVAEPKTLRYRLRHTSGHVVRHARHGYPVPGCGRPRWWWHSSGCGLCLPLGEARPCWASQPALLA